MDNQPWRKPFSGLYNFKLREGSFQALLQAVLADPVLLQAVDPRVLQAVLVSAAAVNIDMEQVAAWLRR